MVRMNRVMVAGNLTRDPVVRKTSTGVVCADIGVAVTDGSAPKNGKPPPPPCFIDVVVWEKQAEVCQQYLRKGSPVLIEGRLQFDEWKDKEGQKRNKLRVRADRVQFLGRPDRAQAPREDSVPDEFIA